MDFDLNEEQRMWQEAVHDFVEREVKPKAREVDEEARFNWEAVRKMGPLGLLGLNVSEDYGGAGVDAVSASIAIEELGWGCGSTALAIAAHNGLGCAPISLFGSHEQKQRFLTRVASGQGKLAALALTEPGAGSDLQGAHADRFGDEWVINAVDVVLCRYCRLYYHLVRTSAWQYPIFERSSYPQTPLVCISAR
jgi:alkylation response protein AidB-like acyl-CoA dehydrogenase